MVKKSTNSSAVYWQNIEVARCPSSLCCSYVYDLRSIILVVYAVFLNWSEGLRTGRCQTVCCADRKAH